MVLSVAVIAALVGWLWSGFESYGFVIGGLVGLVVGWLMRRTIRAEVAAATASLRTEIETMLATRPAPVAADERAFAPAEPVTPRTPRAAARVVTEPPVSIAPATDIPAPAPAYIPPTVEIERAPAQPNILEIAFATARNWLLGGNTIVRVGLVVLFIGLSFLARYAAASGILPIEVRLSFVAAFGIALLVVGFRTRERRPGFGLALQGGGIATIYLTLFAAARLYDTVPMAAAFALMIMVCALGCALALLQRSQALAVTSFLGGFAVPLLLSDGGGSISGVFAYYTLLNIAILFIAQRQTWRGLNLTGFFATFGFATLWQATGYAATDFWPTQIFLIASVLIYVATAILFARSTPGRLGGMVDTTLMFGPAIAGFGLQVALVHDQAFGSTFAALGFAALYLGITTVTMRKDPERLRVMNETMLAIGVGFVTLAVPLALDARWTSAAWALEGAGAFWVGMRQARWMPRMFGLALQLIAAVLYLGGLHDNVAALPIANPGFVGAMIVALAALFTAWWMRRPMPAAESRIGRIYWQVEAGLAAPAFLFGFFFWVLAFAAEAYRSSPQAYAGQMPTAVFSDGTQALLTMLAYIASAWLSQHIARRTGWSVARWPGFTSVGALAIGILATIGSSTHVLSWPAWVIWIAAIVLHLHLTYRNDRDGKEPWQTAALHAAHIGGVWVGTLLLADCLWVAVDRLHLWRSAWAVVSFLASLVAILAILTGWAGRAIGKGGRWPLDTHATDYAWYAAIPLAVLTFADALLVALVSSGDAAPLPYIPLINPVDLTIGLAIFTLALWRRTVTTADPAPRGVAVLHGPGSLGGLAGLAFVAINTVWLRAAHHLAGVAWDGDAMFDSVLVQTGLAILWTLIALTMMVIAHRRAQRTVWVIGAALLGLTVAKLILIDLNAAEGGARIVAFIAVGILMLVVGYLAPLPPRQTETTGDTKAGTAT